MSRICRNLTVVKCLRSFSVQKISCRKGYKLCFMFLLWLQQRQVVSQCLRATLVSMNTYTSTHRKNFGEEGINDTFEIVKNGPCISKCDKVVRMSLNKYFEDKNVIGWHFVTKSPFTTSKTVDSIEKRTSLLPFMD